MWIYNQHFFYPEFFLYRQAIKLSQFLASLAIIYRFSHHIRNDFRFFSIFFPYFQNVANFEEFLPNKIFFYQIRYLALL